MRRGLAITCAFFMACGTSEDGSRSGAGGNAGRVRDAGTSPADTGAVAVDAGQAPVDAGHAPDADQTPADSGVHPDAQVPADSGVAMDAGQALTCPPPGPYGTSQGDTLPQVTLPDCDGNMHTLHSLCNRRASWMFTFAGW